MRVTAFTSVLVATVTRRAAGTGTGTGKRTHRGFAWQAVARASVGSLPSRHQLAHAPACVAQSATAARQALPMSPRLDLALSELVIRRC